MVHYMVGEILEPVMMKMASMMKLKKPGVKAKSTLSAVLIAITEYLMPIMLMLKSNARYAGRFLK